MKISNLPASTSLAPTDVLVKETSAGVTQKIAGSDLVANDLTTTAAGKVLDARQGKALADMLNSKMMFISKSLEIPDGSSSNPSSLAIDLSADIPSGYAFWGADVYVHNGSTEYKLPWFNPALTQGLWVDRYTGATVYLKNTSSGWGTSTLYIIAFLKKQ